MMGNQIIFVLLEILYLILIRSNYEVLLYTEFSDMYISSYWFCMVTKGKHRNRVLAKDCAMSKEGFSENCNNKNHIDCDDCMCTCHIPGTMANLAKNVARLDRNTPGLGETL
jgi:hypothetical protein